MKPAKKSVLVTGAAKRLGRAIALHLGESGWSVAVHYNNSQAEAEETVAALHQKGVHAAAINADLTLEDDTERLIARARAAVGPLTALVNNASVFENDTIATMTRQSWDKHIEANLRAPLVLSRDFAEQLPDVLAEMVVASVPAGEAKDPRRGVPFAFIMTIIVVTIVMTLVQIVALGTLPNLAASKTPLADASRWMGMSLQKNPDAAMAGATPYLRLFGLASGGIYLARGALAAARNGGQAQPIHVRVQPLHVGHHGTTLRRHRPSSSRVRARLRAPGPDSPGGGRRGC